MLLYYFYGVVIGALIGIAVLRNRKGLFSKR